MHHLQVRVLDGVRDQLDRDLLGDDDAFPVSADFREDVGENLDGPAAGVGRHFAALFGGDVAQEAVRFLDQRHVPQPAGAGGAGPLAALVMLVQADQDQADQEGLLVIIDDLFQLDQARPAKQDGGGDGAPGVQHRPQAAAHPQLVEPGRQPGLHVHGDPLGRSLIRSTATKALATRSFSVGNRRGESGPRSLTLWARSQPRSW